MKTGIAYCILISALLFFSASCGKSGGTPNPPPPPAAETFNFSSLTVNGLFNGFTYYGLQPNPKIIVAFDKPLDGASLNNGLSFRDKSGTAIPFTATLQQGDSAVAIQPSSPLGFLSTYVVNAATTLKSKSGGNLRTGVSVNLYTAIDSSDKFPRLSDDALLDLVEQQTLKYFYDFGHPVSGLARERNTSGDIVTTGGSGMGIMALLAGVHRNFITRAEGLARLEKITDFLLHDAHRYHGAFPHWLNGSTGETVPFSSNDNGADLVETSYLMAGLLSARQFFNGAGASETALRDSINKLWQGVEWDWFRQNDQQVLYWHWSPDKGWVMNMKIQGWNECLITYVLAASSPTHPIPKSVYDQGWAKSGGIQNGNIFYGTRLPLGPAFGGPLFFAHYSFLGIDPQGLSDAYANYWEQDTAHSLINYKYCASNPKGYYGYSDSCWGLTASDNPGGYAAHSPTNDLGVITPTAALSSMPYTPEQSKAALHFFYYKLGDRLWKEYGFTDAFDLHQQWFATSFLAIDQGPIIVMIENYRSGLLWNLLMSCTEVKAGLTQLGFQGPHL